MIKRYNNISLATGAPGFLLQVVGQVLRMDPGEQFLGLAVVGAGTALLLVGLAYYAKAKGQNPAWCLMAFLSLIGLIVLACLPDKAPDGRSGTRNKRKEVEDYDDDDDDRPRRKRGRVEDDEDDDSEQSRPRPRGTRRSSSRDPDEEDIDEAPPPGKQAVSEAIVVAEAVPPAHRLVNCAKCQKSLKIPGNVAGKKVRCPSCGEIFRV
jgi:hypothetical protein